MKRATVLVAMGLMVTALGGTPGSAAAPVRVARRSPPARIDRTVSVYAVVIRELVARDRAFGASDAGVVYVLDGSVEGAADPMRAATGDPQRFKPTLKRRLRKQLADLRSLRFVHDRAAVVTGDAPGHVISRGVLC